MSPINNSISPRRRLFSSKHRQKPQQNYSLNSSNQLNTSVTRGQKRENLTIKTGASIEAIKDLMTPSSQPYSQQLKQLLTVNTSTKGRQPVLGNVFIESTKPVRRDSKKPNRSTSKDKEQMAMQVSHKKNLSYQFQKTKDLELIKEQDMQQTVEWKHQKIPLTPNQTIQQFNGALSEYEKTEILQYRRVGA